MNTCKKWLDENEYYTHVKVELARAVRGSNRYAGILQLILS